MAYLLQSHAIVFATTKQCNYNADTQFNKIKNTNVCVRVFIVYSILCHVELLAKSLIKTIKHEKANSNSKKKLFSRMVDIHCTGATYFLFLFWTTAINFDHT